MIVHMVFTIGVLFPSIVLIALGAELLPMYTSGLTCIMLGILGLSVTFKKKIVDLHDI